MVQRARKRERTNDTAGKKPIISPECAEILDALPYYVLLVDSDHYILHANRAVHAQLGLRPEQIVGGYCPKVIHGVDTEFYGCPLEEAAAKGEAIERDVQDINTRHWVRSAIYPTALRTPAGKRVFFHIVTDITEAKHAQEQVAASHERLRAMSGHLETLREEERKRLARDLHDETSQVVASLSAHLEAALSLLPQNADRVRPVLEKARTLSMNIHDELHKVVYELHPSLLDDLGLIAAVESLIDNSISGTGLNVSVKTIGEPRRLTLQVEITLFRVVQEALTNVVKHAAAKNAVVTVRFQRKNVKVSIADDGMGFDVDKAVDLGNRPRGFGILGMRERIELIQGELKISSRPGAGTRIDIRVPLDEPAPDAPAQLPN